MSSQQSAYVTYNPRGGPTSFQASLTLIRPPGPKPYRSTSDCSRGLTIERKELSFGEHSRSRLVWISRPEPYDLANNETTAYQEGPE